MSAGEQPDQGQRSGGTMGLIGDAIEDIWEDPTLLVPYLLAGVVTATVDTFRLADPVPVDVQTTGTNGLVHVRIRSFPGVVRVVQSWPTSLPGLEPAYLASTLAANVLVVACGVLAMALVVSRFDEKASRSWWPVGRLLGYALAVGTLGSVVGGLALWIGFPATLLGVLGMLVVAMRTYPVPVLLLRGRSVVDALRRSVTLTAGHNRLTFGLVTVLGLGAHLLASPVPLLEVDLPLAVGTLLATAVVGPVHALATVHATNQWER
ncbi:hypothetical protein [Haloarchaeobius sp. HME9146]|uniref:hypothetical protein n=1 Tax=Haloarchaeobius sp. HME9146 TaxID=2978732 RepID=UPI0021BE03ED|nr:hypothetical protein [Haloarchaeobius sp. HME9146]MCT9094475.1 hypothetical protein [Haloarchaeobius sp. HME9146]